jgi:hypothetical protein
MPQRHLGRAVEDHGVRVILITGGRHPWEISGLCIFVIIGLALLAGGPAPQSVDALLPGWFVVFWKALLAVGAALALGAVSLPQRSVDQLTLSQLVERTAMIWFGVATLVFPVVLAGTGQRTALTTIGFATAYGTGALWRAWQITRALRKLRNTLRVQRAGAGQ